MRPASAPSRAWLNERTATGASSSSMALALKAAMRLARSAAFLAASEAAVEVGSSEESGDIGIPGRLENTKKGRKKRGRKRSGRACRSLLVGDDDGLALLRQVGGGLDRVEVRLGQLAGTRAGAAVLACVA